MQEETERQEMRTEKQQVASYLTFQREKEIREWIQKGAKRKGYALTLVTKNW